MNQQPIIREYRASDKELVVALLRMNTPQYFSPEEENDFIDYLNNHREEYFVLEDNGQVVGCGGINYADDHTTGKISWDMFHPDQQGKGLGSRLTKFRTDRLKADASIRKIMVRTSQIAFRFYEKMGFELKETIADYWAPGFDLYRMEYPMEGKR